MQINFNNSYNFRSSYFKGEDSAAVKNAPETTSWGWNKEQRRQELIDECKSDIQSASRLKKIVTDYSDDTKKAYKNKFEAECNIASFIERYKSALPCMTPHEQTEEDDDGEQEVSSTPEDYSQMLEEYETAYKEAVNESDEEIIWDLNKDVYANAANITKQLMKK